MIVAKHPNGPVHRVGSKELFQKLDELPQSRSQTIPWTSPSPGPIRPKGTGFHAYSIMITTGDLLRPSGLSTPGQRKEPAPSSDRSPDPSSPGNTGSDGVSLCSRTGSHGSGSSRLGQDWNAPPPRNSPGHGGPEDRPSRPLRDIPSRSAFGTPFRRPNVSLRGKSSSDAPVGDDRSRPEAHPLTRPC